MSISITKLKPGMVVYDAHSQKMGNTTMRTMGVWPVKIVEVHENSVIASWNGNPPRIYWARSGGKFPWRANEPKLVKSGFGYRLAKRGEVVP